MSDSSDFSVCLAVLNPKGRDSFIDYRNGPGSYERGVHAPINYHAYAASTRGAFFDSTEELIEEKDRFNAAVVLIRRRTWISLDAVTRLRQAGVKVIVAWKECSPEQISGQLKTRRAIAAYGKILELADGILTSTLASPPRCGSIDANVFQKKLKFIPTPYPLEFPSWDFAEPVASREGLMIGTREFGTVTRNHIQAISESALLAHELGLSRVTAINSEKKNGLERLRELEKSFPSGVLQIIERPLGYLDFMKLLASHRLIYQMDRSVVPGQIAGDCLLARSLCAGGNSTIEKLAFPEFCDGGLLDRDKERQRIASVLQSEESCEAAIVASQEKAKNLLSYEAVAKNFAEWPLLQ